MSAQSVRWGVAVGLVAVAAASLALGSAQPARAQAGCEATINGSPVSRHATYGDALDIDPDEPVELTLRTPDAPGVIEVTITAGPFSRTVRPLGDARPQPNGDWSGSTDDTGSGLSAGLTEIRLTSDDCELTAWVNVSGGGPFTTVAGGVATAVLVAGVGMQGFGLWSGMRGRGGFRWALLGGIPTGLGACVLAQQSGLTPITPQWAAAWTTPPMAIGGVIQAGLRSLGGRGDDVAYDSRPSARVELPSDSLPPPTPTSSAPPTVSPPPAPSSAPTPGGPPAGMAPSASRPAAPSAARPAPAPATPGPGGSTPPPSAPRAPSVGWPPASAQATPPPAADAPSDASATPPAVAATEMARAPGRDPPRSAYARLDAPEVVTVGVRFPLAAGLALERQSGVSGGELVRPATSRGSYVLTVQVVADGFTLGPEETWRNDLRVTAADPYPAVELHLTAEPQQQPVRPARIEALYSVDGQTIGMAVRAIAVVAEPGMPAPVMPSPIEPVDIGVPTERDAADLTVRIQVADDGPDGRLLWTFDTPHAGIDVPDAPVATSIGDQPERFVRQIVEGIGARQGTPGLGAYLGGVGLTIADQMPLDFWRLYEAVVAATSAGVPPGVFFLSEEPYVPWELATVTDAGRRDAAAPRTLGAQARVGRWVLGQRRPRLPAPVEVRVDGVAVVAGVYDRPGWNRLVEAEGEAAELVQRYGGKLVNAAPEAVLRCLGGDPRANLLHFAMHGVYDPASVMDGLVLVDGTTLDPLQVKGLPLDAMPFVFLNACQVGNGNRVLGDYAGMAEAFLYAGASAVVAPLWAVPDTTARALSQMFYERTFGGEPVAEVLRQARAAETQPSEGATALAFVFYGHPSLRLVRP